MTSWGRVLALLAAGLVLTGCAGEGTAETGREAETLAEAISRPPQHSAEGYARAALATRGQSRGFSVLEVTELDAAEPTDPSAYLVIRIHHDGFHGMWSYTEPVTACYSMSFNHDGIVVPPTWTACPEDARPITYPPAPAWADSAAFEAAFASVLARLPATPSETRVRNALYGAWLLKVEELVDDTNTNLGPDDPRAAVQVRGDDVAVAITAGSECLLGSRVAGTVRTARPTGKCVPTFW
jgi:hypothetical protein